MPGIAGVVMTLATVPGMEALGPRKFLFIILLPAGIPWLVQAFTPYLSLLYLGRVVSCFIYIALGPVTAVLVAEISEPRIRGMLLSAEEITVAIAQMAIYIMAHSLPWDVATAACAGPMILVAALTFFVPESPYWLIRRGQKDAALESLKKLRSPKQDVNLELSRNFSKRPRNIPAFNMGSVLLLAAVFTLRELGGQFVMFSYTVYMFQKAGVGLDAFVCTILVGVVRLVFTVVSAAVVDRVGRRPLLIATSFVCGAAEVVGAVFLLVDVPGSSWVPLAAVMVFVSSYGLGIGPIPWTLMGELIPTPVRNIGSSLCYLSFSLFTFVISFVFPYLMEIGLGYALLVFSSANAILTLLLWAFLPETRGKSLSDLENAFQSSPGHSE
ncbi:Facilitated trehalose transporter Tret1 [Penaeus vannamei]|uniref:Facilitated trehalose transporter Tret1 n=1 Tax=Penaeus vannamei TaxID=6689 RepID=A0A423TLV8_PENVA|nr:Facilitated trehalose transporter Tret1 [Penaeus vannamei]